MEGQLDEIDSGRTYFQDGILESRKTPELVGARGYLKDGWKEFHNYWQSSVEDRNRLDSRLTQKESFKRFGNETKFTDLEDKTLWLSSEFICSPSAYRADTITELYLFYFLPWFFWTPCKQSLLRLYFLTYSFSLSIHLHMADEDSHSQWIMVSKIKHCQAMLSTT